MTGWREPLDDAIDRIVRTMTVAPSNPDLVERVVARLPDAASPRLHWLAGLAAATAVGLLAVWWHPFAEPPRSQVAGRPLLIARTTASLAEAPPPVAPQLPQMGAPPAATVLRRGLREAAVRVMPVDRGLALLTPPDALVVPEIERPSPAEVAPLELPPIEIQPLAVAELAAPLAGKE